MHVFEKAAVSVFGDQLAETPEGLTQLYALTDAKTLAKVLRKPSVRKALWEMAPCETRTRALRDAAVILSNKKR